MKKTSHFNVTFASTPVNHTLRKHVESVHEGKKPFQCNICVASFSQKGHMNRHFESVMNRRSLFNATSVMQAFLKKEI
jgi:uncharacterized Zn-finger protein